MACLHHQIRAAELKSDLDCTAGHRFEEPIPLPDGRKLVTLMDAGEVITRLPEAVHTAAEWQAAMEALILVATLAGPTMFARIGIMRAPLKPNLSEAEIWTNTSLPPAHDGQPLYCGFAGVRLLSQEARDCRPTFWPAVYLGCPAVPPTP
jgi:hypothetical protein